MSPEKINKNENLWLCIAGCGVFALVCVIRMRLLEIPLERDEGEYAYVAQQLLSGALPYTESYSMKLPGIYIVYAIILSIFGQTHTGIHLALLMTNVASAVLIVFLGGRLYNRTVGIVAGSCFLVMTLGPSAQGHWANAEHFVILFALGGLLLMLNALENESSLQILLSGLLLGFAFLIKQHGVFFLIFGFLYLCLYLYKNKHIALSESIEKAGLLALGGIIPLALTALLYYAVNRFDVFWFWTYEYASEYVSMVPLSHGFSDFIDVFWEILKPNFLILLLSLIGLSSIVWDKNFSGKYIFPFGLFVISFLAITPGLYFRPHYFILWMPALALFAGIGIGSLVRKQSLHGLNTATILLVFSISLAVSFYKQKDFLFSFSSIEASRAEYSFNPFPESLVIGDYINKNTDEGDEIVVLGSEPQIYFYSKRKSATGFLYMYPLMENHKFARLMQVSMISEIESRDPKFVVFVNMNSSWLKNPNSYRLILDWKKGYIKEKYELTGLVYMPSSDSIAYKWGRKTVEGFLSATKANPPRKNLLIYKKKI